MPPSAAQLPLFFFIGGTPHALQSDYLGPYRFRNRFRSKRPEYELTTQPDVAKGDPLRPLAIRESCLVVTPEAAPADVEEAD